MIDRQRPMFRVSIELPAGTAQPLPLPPRLATQVADTLAHCGATLRLQSRSLRIERRGREVPVHIVELVADHATAIAETLRQHRCTECDQAARIQPAPDATAGASWQSVCPGCGDTLRP